VDASDEVARQLTTAIKGGDTDRLGALLAADRGLASCLVVDEGGGGRTPLHLLADAPGFRPRPAGTVRLLVAAGADLDAPAVGMWHAETPLHWAASNDDVALIEALLDAGADLEHPGSSIGGGPPIQSALGYGQWNAVRELARRGAALTAGCLVVLGRIDEVAAALDAAPQPADELDLLLWNACRRGDVPLARLLLDRGADPAWRAPWSGETAAEVARAAGQQHVLSIVDGPVA
jgi:hypothetical protein